MAKKKAPKRGSEEERWYYLTEEGRNSIKVGDEFDADRAMELLFEDAPEVNWHHCSVQDFMDLRDAGVITKEECDTACDIFAFMIGHKFCSAQVKTPLSEKILIIFFGGPWAFWPWLIILMIIRAVVLCMNN